MNREQMANKILADMGGQVAVNGVIKKGEEAKRFLMEMPQPDFESLVEDYRLLSNGPYWWSVFEP